MTAVDEVAWANKNGLDIIITDHHSVPPVIPRAVAVLNPKRPDDDFLEHRERKDIMRQANKCVVRPHIGKHMQISAPNHKLQRACTRNVFMFVRNVRRVEQLNDSPP